jgi:hypothetical protein
MADQTSTPAEAEKKKCPCNGWCTATPEEYKVLLETRCVRCGDALDYKNLDDGGGLCKPCDKSMTDEFGPRPTPAVLTPKDENLPPVPPRSIYRMDDEHEIAVDLVHTMNKVVIGGFYHHYSDPKKLYKVITVAVDESDTDNHFVIYKAVYGRLIQWARPLRSWTALVNGAPRFTLVYKPDSLQARALEQTLAAIPALDSEK